MQTIYTYESVTIEELATASVKDEPYIPTDVEHPPFEPSSTEEEVDAVVDDDPVDPLYTKQANTDEPDSPTLATFIVEVSITKEDA